MRSPYHVLVENGTKVLISSCRKILEYSPEKIEIKLKDDRILLCGSDHTLCDFFGDELQIGGKIESISFMGGISED